MSSPIAQHTDPKLNIINIEYGSAIIPVDLDRLAQTISMDKGHYFVIQFSIRLLEALNNVERK